MQISDSLIPLGSIVRGTGSRLLMIVSRALMVTIDDRTAYFDYAACLYPEGVIGDSMLYLNAEDIAEVLFHGFSDDADAALMAEAREVAATSTLSKGDTREFREAAARIHREAEASDRG